MSFHLSKKTFKVDEITGEIIQPQVFLCNRQLDRLGELYPILDLRIKATLNGADEISFRLPKNEENLYGSLKDYSVVLVTGFGYFEVSPTVSDTFTSIKNVQGSSLGEAELSQLFCTLECNTDQVISNFISLYPNQKYIPTILYSEDAKYSLLHKILENAPNYNVGNVDDTLRQLQRTYSFSNKDIISCFSEIAEEISCIFEVVVNKNENGIVERTVNVYDAKYCANCKSRHILNGFCQDCQSTNIAGIGNDTTIQISTANLSDEITISPDGNLKNCFIIEGGDDMMTNTIKGIMPSGTNKLMLFSDHTFSSFSPLLQEKYKNYVLGVNSAKDRYAKTLELQYGILDLILYLQSGRMPDVIAAERELDEEVGHVITQFKSNFPNGLAWNDANDKSSKNGMVKQALSLFVDRGYTLRLENENYNGTNMRWTGDIILYKSANHNAKATISVSDTNSTITYSDPENTETTHFYIKFSNDTNTYLKQITAFAEKKYIKDETPSKDWEKYCLNRLFSYKSGYQACIDELTEIKIKTNLNDVENYANKIIAEYQKHITEISNYIVKLNDIIYHLYCYYSDTHRDPNFSSSAHVFENSKKAFQNMVHYIRYGTWDGGPENHTTDYPLYCKACGSTNVTLAGCNQCKHPHVVTYSTIAEAIYHDYAQFGSTGSLESQREKTRANYKLNAFLGDSLYKELCSFLREDTYSNSNFISDGLSNSELITKAEALIKRAQQELAKACVPQHTLSGNVYAFVAYSKLNPNDFPIQNAYSEFKLGNVMRYFTEDGSPYKLRLSSEEFSWPSSGAELTVEFTDVIEYKNGGTSDLASLMQTVGNLSTSFDSVKKQAEQGVKANNTFTAIKNEGLHSALSNVLNAENIDVQIDDKGITLRRFDYDLDDYSDYQMKLANRNIVMTEDNWNNAKLAIGLGRYNNKPVYGVWANLLVGDLTITKELHVKNENNSIILDENGITLDGGAITWTHPIRQTDVEGLDDNVKNINQALEQSRQAIQDADNAKSDATCKITALDKAVAKYLGLTGATTIMGSDYMISPYIIGGYLNITATSDNTSNQIIIDPENQTDTDYIFAVKHNEDVTFGIKPSGSASFRGKIYAKSGSVGGWNIDSEKIYFQREYNKDGNENDRVIDNFYIKSSDCSLTSSYTYNNSSSSSQWRESIKSIVSQGQIKCSFVMDPDKPPQRKESYVLINGNGILCKGINDETRFEINNSDGLIRENGQYLNMRYCVVQTGDTFIPEQWENDWAVFTVTFQRPYTEQPFINIISKDKYNGQEFALKGFTISLDKYTGFTYAVYAPDSTIVHHMQWFAVGNIT